MTKREVIGNLLGTTTPTEVTICIDPEIVRSAPLRLGEYLIIDYQCEAFDEPVLVSVKEIGLSNLNMPESILTSPREFEALKRIGDLTEGEILTAEAQVLGFLNSVNELEFPRFSPPPGATVYRAPVDLLKRAFGQGHIEIGHLLTNPDVRVEIDVNELVRRHLAILAITGGGKGNTVAMVTSQILEMGGAVVVIDPHSEYLPMREDFGDKVKAFSVNEDLSKQIYPLRFKYNSFSANDFISMLRIPSTANLQRKLFRDAFAKLKDTEWGLDDLKNALRDADDNTDSDQFQGIMSRMNEVIEFMMLDKNKEVPLAGDDQPSLVAPGQMTILSLAGLDTMVQQAVVKHVSRKILSGGIAARRDIEAADKIPCPVLIVIEECHNFIPANGQAASMRILRRIASEGRKFGVGLCVVSQRPGKIDSDVLSQCNSMIVLRIVNPKDQRNIQDSAEALSQEMMKELPTLNVGEAVIFGPAINLPALVKIDKYPGKLGGEDIKVVDIWKEGGSDSRKVGQTRHDDDGAFDRRSW
ncbi:MAG: putative DNA helicase [Candidatus Thorarchaeota archaeon]|nr:MAG: putative DNA helicase [Candidatus Thorarchaeota archaeon]